MTKLAKFNKTLKDLDSIVEELKMEVFQKKWYNYKTEKVLEILNGIKESRLYYVDGKSADELAFSGISIIVNPEEAGIATKKEYLILM